MKKALAAMVALAGFSMATYWAAFAQSPESQPPAPEVIEITAKKYEFSPSEIRVRKGTRVELKVHSEDDTHGVKLDVYPEGTKDKSDPGLVFDRPGYDLAGINH
jgi:plastocyanin